MDKNGLNQTEDEIDTSSDELKIVIDEDIAGEKITRKRKRADTINSSDDEDTALPENCLKVEEKLCSTAAKNHLTAANVKNILKRVVTNEHVLAIVKLREEEMEDEEDTPEPKLTRSKAKELKKITPDMSWPLSLTPVKIVPVTSPEVTKLIEKDLPDEESDEEYQPALDEHEGSDDERDTLGSLSDIDSQPRTPVTPGQCLDIDQSPTKYTDDGLFKIPREIGFVEEKCEPTIALRTRSKLCLSDKAIEEIEESFVPPDDVVEEYQIDDVWNEFLTEFTNPETPPPIEDDEANDPEYNASADKEQVDLEELREDRAVKVSKKELNDLVAELFDMSNMFEMQDPYLMPPNSYLLPRPLSPNSNNEISAKGSPIKLLDISHSRHILEHNEMQKKTCIEEIAQNISLSAEQLNESIELSKESINGDKSKENASSVITQLSIKVEILDKETNAVSSTMEFTPSFTSNDKILKTVQFNSQGLKREDLPQFTLEQRQILDQQIRQHVQILTQCFLQLHGHPELWQHGPRHKEYLMNLKELGKGKPHSAFIACNLQGAIDLCNRWEHSLSEDTQEMRDMMQFIINENIKAIKRREQGSLYHMKFSKQFLEIVLDSNVFIYPQLLPLDPFRVDRGTRKCEYVPSEDQLIAMGIAEFDEYINMNPKIYSKNPLNHRSRKLAHLISTFMVPLRGENALTSRIRYLKRHKLENPVNYFFKHGHPPKTHHTIIPFNPTFTPRNHPLEALPKSWQFYLNPSKFQNEIIQRLGALSTIVQNKYNVNNGSAGPTAEIEQDKENGDKIITEPDTAAREFRQPPLDNRNLNTLNAQFLNHRPKDNNYFLNEKLIQDNVNRNKKFVDKANFITKFPPTQNWNTNSKLVSFSSNDILHNSGSYTAYRIKSLGTDHFSLSPVTDSKTIKDLISTSVKQEVRECRLPPQVENLVASQITTNNGASLYINISPERNVHLLTHQSSCGLNKVTLKGESSASNGVRSGKSAPSLPSLLLVNSCSPNGSESTEDFTRDSDGSASGSLASEARSDTPGLPIESSTPAQDKTKKTRIQLYKNHCGPLNFVRCCRHRCTCECNHLEEPLPQNQTLLTQFFKKKVKNNLQLNKNCDHEETPKDLEETTESLKLIYTPSETSSDEGDERTLVTKSIITEKQNTINGVLNDTSQPDSLRLHELTDSQSRTQRCTINSKNISLLLDEPVRDQSFEEYTNNSYEYNNESFTLNTVLSKLQCLLIINCERRAIKSNQKLKLKSDLAWKVRAKLFKKIQEVEDEMLPSMPNLTMPSKSSLDRPDESSNLVGIPIVSGGPMDEPDPPIPSTPIENKKTGEEKTPKCLRHPPRSSLPGQSTKHRLAARAQRELEANKAMFATSDPYVDDRNDNSCATAYFEKVQSRLNSNAETNKFIEFQDILDKFNAEVETPCDLYNKLNNLFGPENDDLTEEFLTFMTAGQSVEIGRFMDHFMLTNMSDFIERLQIYFARRPAQLRKVLWCLERIADNIDRSEDNVTIESIKATILPHLKGNKHLVNWFLRLLPNEKTSEKQINSGYEVLDIDGLSKNTDNASLANLDFEVLNIPPIQDNYGNDLCTCTCHDTSDEKFKSRSRHCISCGMKVMQGRLYIQHGRGLRAARVQWEGAGGGQDHARRLSTPQPITTAPPHRKRAASLDPLQHRDSDDERVSPRRIIKIVRTPTSKTKCSRMKNTTKSNEIEDGTNKPSCSKNIIRDEDVDNSLRVRHNDPEHLADILPQGDALEEPGIFNGICTQHNAATLGANTVDETSSQYNEEERTALNLIKPDSHTEPLQSSEISNSTIALKSENIDIPFDDVDCIMDEELENTPTIKVETDQNWTRDEDKAILTVLQCESDSDYTFEKIQRILPHRSIGEIRDRFQSVMQLLQQMASDNV